MGTLLDDLFPPEGANFSEGERVAERGGADVDLLVHQTELISGELPEYGSFREKAPGQLLQTAAGNTSPPPPEAMRK